MARTIQEIYNAIITEKQVQTELNGLQPAIDNSQTLLDDLTSESKVAIWRLMYWVFAVALWIHETLWDAFKAEIEELKEAAIQGTPSWLQKEALAYQHGDTLTLVNGRYVYEEIDNTVQIIKRCAIVEQANQVLIKVAKESGGEPAKLDDTPGSELDQFTAYMLNYKRFAGVNMSVLSYNADLLKLDYNVYYDPIYSLQTIRDNVTSAINEYLSNLPFNGKIRRSSIEDAIQEAGGVVDFDHNGIEAKYESGSYQAVERVYKPVSGYAKIDPDYEVESNFTFTANT